MPQGRLSELEVLQDLPGYQAILRTILKSQIKQLVEQLSFYAGEEAILLSASLSDGTLSHIGSESGEFFLNTHDQLKKQFLGFCMKRHRLKSSPKAKTKADDAQEGQQQIKRRKLSDNDQNSQNLENTQNQADASKCSTNSETDISSKNTQENNERETAHAQDANTSESVGHELGDDGETEDSDEHSYNSEESDDDSEESEGESDSESAAGSGVDLFYFDGTNVIVKQEVEDPDYRDSATGSKRGGKDRLHTAIRMLKANTESDVSVDDIVNAASSVGEDSASSLNDISNKDQAKFSKEELIEKYGKYVRHRNVDLPKIKYRRNSASFQKKYQAILAVESGAASKCEVARQFGVPQNTLSSWIKAADQIKQEYLSSDYDPTRERARKSRFPDIEKALLEWARDAKTHNIPLATAVLIDKANEIARSLGYTEEQFICKVGWADRFKLRFGLNVKKRKRSSNPYDS